MTGLLGKCNIRFSRTTQDPHEYKPDCFNWRHEHEWQDTGFANVEDCADPNCDAVREAS